MISLLILQTLSRTADQVHCFNVIRCLSRREVSNFFRKTLQLLDIFRAQLSFRQDLIPLLSIHSSICGGRAESRP